MEVYRQSDTSKSILNDLFEFLRALLEYIFIRLKLFLFYCWAFFIWLTFSIEDLKDNLVKKMFWGRSRFYRSAFQFSVGLITIIIGIGGLAGRLNLFMQEGRRVLAYPTETLGDADYLDEGASIQAIVAEDSLVRGYDVQKYIVQRGDILSSIASKFGVSEDTIRWANGITGDYIKVGQELEILPINGVVHKVKEGDSIEKIAQKYDATVQDIYDINWLDSTILKSGQELLVPNGSMPQPPPPPRPPAPGPSYTYTGGGGGTGSFIRPCGCGKITNWFSTWHGGVDIAQAGGCTIVASDAGVVTMARWGGRGGLQIMINHGNGFVTLYAHNSAIYVKEGQHVTRGQPIGYMGATGSATGVHLHFGVQRNGVWVDPRIYVPI